MVRVAICYFGLTRSLRLVYKTHEERIYAILRKAGIDYDIYLHTWKTTPEHNTVWNRVNTVEPDYEEPKLINPTEYRIDDQAPLIKDISDNFADYWRKDIFERMGGDSLYEWYPYLVRNNLYAMESQKRVTTMLLNSNKEYDYVIYIRPDVHIYTDFPVEMLSQMNNDSILVLNYDQCIERPFHGLNALFGVVPYTKCREYGCRIDEAKEYRKNIGRLAAEHYLGHIVRKYFKTILYTDFKLSPVRP